MSSALVAPKIPEQWRAALDALPSNPPKIPAFFFAHGSPMLVFPESGGLPPSFNEMGPRGSLANFLRDFGPALLEKYKPKGIVIFSAHWETEGERVVSNYEGQNPLFMDYYGFGPELYQIKFNSQGDRSLSQRVVDSFTEVGCSVSYSKAGMRARLSSPNEVRGEDGRGFPGHGLDHGVFVPFTLMFGETLQKVPVVQVSIEGPSSRSLPQQAAEANWQVGKAVAKLREEGYLILSGGLTIHNLMDRRLFSESMAPASVKTFSDAIYEAGVQAPEVRKAAMLDLVSLKGFREAHPREEHFLPIYVAAGAGEDGQSRALGAMYGAHTFAFGL
ncbi:Extradiol ring-cleavage dioxygenase class III enzyme subunit B [Coniophora puteana RWD-64-598 SS2]|uniref:Extradiol ring-cleavage dioxygenase class III enzyme subunit B n=1 Tax=Coniophora puteana (strain RWD-64-598) TaxID=741705 RepID=A0A5M3N1J9_CONPW|nr:Extradiol ring-cleavage dioxygenase class III enzyme subunit B [Coniophora puteana RWD-64-598 SS2]EIW85280.1 Extradiol ring-cleavage dioxygenase class III enzyme subunit B [Coniophora puteana RWD-64-598 SS2]